MSLINQMLRDLENRKLNPNTSATLNHNIKVNKTATSKVPLLILSLLVITASGGAYWAFQYNKVQAKTALVIVAENSHKEPVPTPPYDQVLAAPNAINETRPKLESKATENIPRQTVAAAKPVPAKEITKTPVSAQQPAVADIPVKKSPAPPKPITVKEQADLLYRQAENNPDDVSVAYKLEKALQLDARHLKARLLMVKTLHNQGKTDKTAAFLDQSLALFPDNPQFINTRAQLFLHQKNPDRALKILEKTDMANSANESSLALLAATYQQLDSSTNAAKVYQKLVTINSEKAEHWLGLALAHEELGNLKLAREAYQQALNKNTLKESVTGYIKQKLIELR